jgi:hypothetical protein
VNPPQTFWRFLLTDGLRNTVPAVFLFAFFQFVKIK